MKHIELECPHCNNHITVKEAITVLNGSGYIRRVNVKTPDGKIHLVNAHLVNPNAVEVLDDALSST